jgi:hypothetical protein
LSGQGLYVLGPGLLFQHPAQPPGLERILSSGSL